MEQAFHLTFNTHTVYVTLDDEKFYKLNKHDLSREEVEKIPVPSKENPIMVMHKSQFDLAKGYLMDMRKPIKINLGTAEIYNQIGFLTDDEFVVYKKEFEKELADKYSSK
ncbi:hypothetical protein [Paenibacillus terrae]|uniref:hypothetical protein n=1 Tax=Paenibacillus terrae TaxID=159743 RepID=UPI0005CC1F8F|nr:hypothetical protein [Paenibacillus terrae]